MIVTQIGEMDARSHSIVLYQDEFSDEYFWEFVDTMDLIHQIIAIEHIMDFEQSGGMILLEDQCEDLNRFQHRVTLTAWHPEAKWLTWIQIVSTQPRPRAVVSR